MPETFTHDLSYFQDTVLYAAGHPPLLWFVAHDKRFVMSQASKQPTNKNQTTQPYHFLVIYMIMQDFS
jgi:hypothetical protein